LGRQLERNLDAAICAPLRFRAELDGFVHRPQFKHVIYAEPEYLLVGTPPSSSLQSLKEVVASLDIEEDPWVLDQRAELQQHQQGPKRSRIDQRLSRVIDKQDTFTHKGLRDFERAADEICSDLGEWAADWYIEQVCKQMASAGGTFPEFSFTWSQSERKYLLRQLARIEIATVPDDDPDDVMRRSSDKVEKLIDVLLDEKASFEGLGMGYRGLVFVTRRDAVLALTEVLARHPRAAHVFRVGSLLGESGNSRRNSFLDITRRLLRMPSSETLADFRIGDLNLIVATAVAEEGLDIQACCNVVRWDVPANMVSWAQSRGRARQEHSSFVLMLSNSLAFEPTMRQWENLEIEMTKLYNTKEELRALRPENEDKSVVRDDGKLRFRVEATGYALVHVLVTPHLSETNHISAVLTGKSAIEHISHFCSILPYSGSVNHVPLFDIDPPDYPLDWHTNNSPRTPYAGPYGCTLTLPRLLHSRFRSFSTPRTHPTKVSARRDVAFQAYRALYENGLLNEHLLPPTDVLKSELESEVRILLKEVEQREGTALVSSQMDPWRLSSDGGANKRWWSRILEIDGFPPLRMLTQTALPSLQDDELPIMHARECPPFKVRVREEETPIVAGDDGGILSRAKEFTRRFFWPMYCTRMKWDQTDFLHLFIPVDESPTVWDERRALASDPSSPAAGGQTLFSPFSWFERRYGHVDDVFIVNSIGTIGKFYQFTRMRNTPLTPEEKADVVRRHMRKGDDDGAAKLEIRYPLIEARSLVKRNFLMPLPNGSSEGMDAIGHKLLLKDFTEVALISSHEAQYALWTPSIIRHLQMASTASSMRDALFGGTPLAEIPLDLLRIAITAPVAQEHGHYQRLETLGDTALKFAASIQVLSEHPLWHEGYLARRKDHAVSNANLAKMAIHKKLYQWIIRDRFVPKRWKPRRTSDPAPLLFEGTTLPSLDMSGMTEKQKRRAKVARTLSTKVLADVVESLIGAAYLHGGFALGIECMKVFDLGLSWSALPACIHEMHSNVTDFDRCPTQIAVVESILGYTFRRKAIAVEALTHASYQSDLETTSYERMEFLGDAVLDMLVTDYLYHAPGKDYSPGIFTRSR
jgi:endoribonuclease Dicer